MAFKSVNSINFKSRNITFNPNCGLKLIYSERKSMDSFIDLPLP